MYRARSRLGRRLSNRIGRRGAVLLLLAFGDFGIGWSFLSPTREVANAQNALWRDHFMPSWAWGGLWLIVGAMCLVAAFRHRDTFAFVGAVSLKVLWACMEFTGWRAHEIDQGYRPALVWTVFAGMIFAIAGMAEPRKPPAMEPGEGRADAR